MPAIDSPKKWTNKFLSFAVLSKQAKTKKKSFFRFLGESTACQSAYGFIWPLGEIHIVQIVNYLSLWLRRELYLLWNFITRMFFKYQIDMFLFIFLLTKLKDWFFVIGRGTSHDVTAVWFAWYNLLYSFLKNFWINYKRDWTFDRN